MSSNQQAAVSVARVGAYQAAAQGALSGGGSGGDGPRFITVTVPESSAPNPPGFSTMTFQTGVSNGSELPFLQAQTRVVTQAVPYNYTVNVYNTPQQGTGVVTALAEYVGDGDDPGTAFPLEVVVMITDVVL